MGQVPLGTLLRKQDIKEEEVYSRRSHPMKTANNVQKLVMHVQSFGFPY